MKYITEDNAKIQLLDCLGICTKIEIQLGNVLDFGSYPLAGFLAWSFLEYQQSKNTILCNKHMA